MSKCSICSTEFSLDDEGGIEGDLGMLPVSFCPFCLSGIFDMSKQIIQNSLNMVMRSFIF